MLNETETRIRLIDPKLEAAGWGNDQIAREHYYRRDIKYTPGRIILRGSQVKRRSGRVADYLLRYSGLPIAVVEAKAESEPPESGLEQAKAYARDLDTPFVYATNGHRIVEYDYFTLQSRELEGFPSPRELWGRWLRNTGLTGVTDPIRLQDAKTIYDPEASEARYRNPLLHPYCPTSLTGKEPRYYQEIAVARIIERVMRTQNRILLTMATGTGKTFVAFQVAWKLVRSGWFSRQESEKPTRILFLADRVVLRDQAYNAFSPFAARGSDPRHLIVSRPVPTHFDIYFGIYQTLWSEDENGVRLYESFPSEFFDVVIIDECHRSGWGTWKDILEHFSSALHLGMTATPGLPPRFVPLAKLDSMAPERVMTPV